MVLRSNIYTYIFIYISYHNHIQILETYIHTIHIHSYTYIYNFFHHHHPPLPTPQGGRGTGALLCRPITMGWGGGVPSDAGPYILYVFVMYFTHKFTYSGRCFTKLNNSERSGHKKSHTSFFDESPSSNWIVSCDLNNLKSRKMSRKPRHQCQQPTSNLMKELTFLFEISY